MAAGWGGKRVFACLCVRRVEKNSLVSALPPRLSAKGGEGRVLAPPCAVQVLGLLPENFNSRL